VREPEGDAALPRVVGVGASAGGVDALVRLVRPLPASFPGAICVVLHVASSGQSLLSPILARSTDLTVVVAEEGQLLECGHVYVAPNDRHLLIDDGRLRLDRGPKENGVRPAVDAMLRTLAAAYGSRAVAVILSGGLGDGAAGAVAVRDAGGVVVVQDPDDSTVPSMPTSALRAVGEADAVLRAADIGTALAQLVPTAAEEEDAAMPASGAPSAFTCPECNGSLWEVKDGAAIRYGCRVGHTYTEDAMLIEQGSEVEAALGSALEALEERAEFLRSVADRHGDRRPQLRDRFSGAADDALERAELVRTALGGKSEMVE
jgi:two-component system chemotaxis response regulator CheB